MISVCTKAQKFANGMQGFPNPSISNMTTYGSVPVGLYTGTPNISIPLYNFQLKDINLPINLNYHPHNVKPNNLPGDLGLGWSLECGGFITRVVKGIPDTAYDNPNLYLVDMTETDLLDDVFDILNCSSIGNSRDQNTPDEYQFNFLGYSGSFIYDIEKNRWMVQSDSDIKVEYTRIHYRDARSQISIPTTQYYDYLKSEGFSYSWDPLGVAIIDSFTLTTPDGYKYVFGGTNNTDYNISFKWSDGYANSMTWHLAKIITPNKHEVEFKYKLMPQLINGNMSFNIPAETLYQWHSIFYDYELQLGVQLSEIVDNTDHTTLASFQYASSIQLKYDSEYAWMTAADNGAINYFTKQKVFTPNQLKTLSILNNIKYNFTYTTNSNERLKLKKITKIGEPSQVQTYSFNYYSIKLPGYNTGHYDNLGFFNGKDFSYYFTDAFFEAARNKDTHYSEGMKYTQNRLGDATGQYVTAEMLKTITYPTNGVTEFIYEPNVIFQMVSSDRHYLQPARSFYPGTPDYTYPGGVRIRQINNYDTSRELLTRKHYYYTTNFTPDNRDGASSGILSFTPQYVWGLNLYNLYSSINIMPEYVPYKILMSQSSNPLWYNFKEENVGYSKVVECNEDKNGNLIDGYTVHTFRNFGPGYMDEDPIAMLNNEYTTSNTKPANTTPYGPYTPCTSQSLKRGVLLSKESYDNKGIIKQKETYQYAPIEKDSIILTEFILSSVIDYNPEDISRGFEKHAFGGTYYKKSYNYLPSEKQTYTYDDQGNALSTKKKFIYGKNKLVKSEITEDGIGNVYEEKIRYVTDMLNFPYVPPYSFFYVVNQLHFTNYPVEKTKIKNGKVIENETYFYKLPIENSKTLLKDKVYTLGQNSDTATYKGLHNVGNELVADVCNIPAITYLAYDSYGNPTYIRNEKDKTETVYLYGYKGKYVIAEIKNTDYKSVAGILGDDLISRLANAVVPSYEDKQKVGKLRSQLTTSFITTYEYIPYIGISKITDPKDVTTYFKYDKLGRLIQKNDNKSQLVSSYKYSNNL